MIYKVLNEAVIGMIDNEYRIDLSDSYAKHACRIKISKKSGDKFKHGTSVPIHKTLVTYDQIRYADVVKATGDSKHLLPLIAGFAAIYHDDLIKLNEAFLYGDYTTQMKLRPYIEMVWVNYYNQFKDANESIIRDYANKMTGLADLPNKKKKI